MPPTGNVQFLPGQTQQFHANTAPDRKILEETELDLILNQRSCSCGKGHPKGISYDLGKKQP